MLSSFNNSVINNSFHNNINGNTGIFINGSVAYLVANNSLSSSGPNFQAIYTFRSFPLTIFSYQNGIIEGNMLNITGTADNGIVLDSLDIGDYTMIRNNNISIYSATGNREFAVVMYSNRNVELDRNIIYTKGTQGAGLSVMFSGSTGNLTTRNNYIKTLGSGDIASGIYFQKTGATFVNGYLSQNDTIETTNAPSIYMEGSINVTIWNGNFTRNNSNGFLINLWNANVTLNNVRMTVNNAINRSSINNTGSIINVNYFGQMNVLNYAGTGLTKNLTVYNTSNINVVNLTSNVGLTQTALFNEYTLRGSTYTYGTPQNATIDLSSDYYGNSSFFNITAISDPINFIYVIYLNSIVALPITGNNYSPDAFRYNNLNRIIRSPSQLVIASNTTSISCNSANEGMLYYDGVLKHFYGCDASIWRQLDN